MKIGEKVKSINMKNKGITLVEVLIVVSILAIMIGTAGISISLMFSRDAEQCAKTIDMALERVRMSSMSQKGTFTLDIDSGNNQLVTRSSAYPGEDVVEDFQRQVIVSFPDMADATVLSIIFDKSTGKVQSVMRDGTEVTDRLIRIRCENQSGSKVATVVLIRKTGKHYVEYGS